MPKVNKLWFRFSGNPTDDGFFIEDNHAGVGNEHMGSPSERKFNDLEFYRGLIEDISCRSATISSLKIRHNDYCHGIQASYRVVSMDGSTKIVEGPENFFSSGYYSYRARSYRARWTHSYLRLRDNEYIIGLSVRQGDILDAMIVVTNQRRVTFGGNGGAPFDLGTPRPSSMEIVAFCGTVYGVCGRIGYYARDWRWEQIGTHVLVRELVRKGRARPSSRGDDGVLSQRLTSLDEGVFRTVMGFLA